MIIKKLPETTARHMDMILLRIGLRSQIPPLIAIARPSPSPMPSIVRSRKLETIGPEFLLTTLVVARHSLLVPRMV
jgi:hypothetical protein